MAGRAASASMAGRGPPPSMADLDPPPSMADLDPPPSMADLHREPRPPLLRDSAAQAARAPRRREETRESEKGEPQSSPASMGGAMRAGVTAAMAVFLAVAASAAAAAALPRFAEAPEYRNGEGCPAAAAGVCDPGLVHIAMTLDAHYLRGSMAAVYSLLKHASCPESIFFHFLAAEAGEESGPEPELLRRAVAASFPSLRFEIYPFRAGAVAGLISASVRAALEAPLNYARNHLADLLPRCVPRAIYLDSDVLAADDVRRLWETRLPAAAVVAAPEYCHANFSRYFTPAFWSDPGLGGRVFAGRRRPPCYFNTGVMVIDLRRWRAGNYRQRIERWMEIQKEKRIYELGSLPPFLLVFAGEVEAVDHRWNQHGLGGDNVHGSCRPLHDGPVSLMHWSGKGKPWDRLDAGRPCPLDHTWRLYDLYIPSNGSGAASPASGPALSASLFSW